MFEENASVDLEFLVSKCLRGDSDAWAKLVDRFQSLVYSVPKRLGLNDEDASDVFATTFSALYKSLDRIDNPTTIPKWLMVTSSRESYRFLRSRNVLSNNVGMDDRSLDEILVDDDIAIDEKIHSALEADELRIAMKSLNDRCRELLGSLYNESEVSYQEISNRMNLPIGSIGPTKARCLDKLRTILLKTPFFESLYQSAGAIAPTKRQ